MKEKEIDKVNVIPIMHCFDNKYSLPAAVAFYSMLKNANKNYYYKLFVLHSDITDENQKKLEVIVNSFPNAAIEFIDMKGKFSTLFDNTKIKGHYSKEMYYKFLPAEMFKEYDKIIVTDVDVCYEGDISKDFCEFDVNDDYYLAGVKTLSPSPKIEGNWLSDYGAAYKAQFSEDEINKLLIGAGYMIFNLRKMREDHLTEKFVDYAQDNLYRLRQPEQDVINLVCYPKIKLIRAKAMVCTYLYDIFKTEDSYKLDLNYSEDEVKDTLENPIQIHYASTVKPWNGIPPKNSNWFSYLLEVSELVHEKLKKEYSTLLNDFLASLFFRPKSKRKKVLSFKLPMSSRRFTVIKEKF